MRVLLLQLRPVPYALTHSLGGLLLLLCVRDLDCVRRVSWDLSLEVGDTHVRLISGSEHGIDGTLRQGCNSVLILSLARKKREIKIFTRIQVQTRPKALMKQKTNEDFGASSRLGKALGTVSKQFNCLVQVTPMAL